MIALPKLILIVLVAAAAWYALRWLNRAPPAMQRRAARPGSRPAIEAEELVCCGVCGTYLTLNARGCGKPRCPRPR
jgi:hypothetical protein